MHALLITTMRNEGAQLIDWIAHHRALGFTGFLVMSNDCKDGTDALLDRLAERGYLHHQPNPREGDRPIQWQALRRADDHPERERADWLMVADVDEFLVIHAGDGRLADLIATAPEAAGFAVPWRLFGAGDVRGLGGGSPTARFTRGAEAVTLWPVTARCFKSLYRNDGRTRKLGVHRPRAPVDGAHDPAAWVDGASRPLRRDPLAGMLPNLMQPDAGNASAQLNHYATGSPEDYMLKRDRGRPNHESDTLGLEYWTDHNLCDVEDRSALRLAGAVEAERHELLNDERTAALHEGAVLWRHRRLEHLLSDRENFRLYARLVASKPARALPIDEQRALVERHIRLGRPEGRRNQRP